MPEERKEVHFTVYANVWTRIHGFADAKDEDELRELIQSGDFYSIRTERMTCDYDLDTLDIEGLEE